jgi:hypothetical protein
MPMPGFKVLTDLPPEKCVKTTWRAAQDIGFTLSGLEPDGRHFLARKGNWLLNHFFGNLFTPYCQFKISAEVYDNGTEVVVEREQAATVTTGKLGAWRVHRQAEELTDAIAAALQNEGGKVLERKEF